MILTSEEVQSYIDEIRSSDLSPEIKEKAFQLLSSPDLSIASLESLIELIQKDIDADIASLDGLGEQLAEDPAYQAIVQDTERQIQEIVLDLQDSMNFVETEGAMLESQAAELSEAASTARLEEVKNNLAKNA